MYFADDTCSINYANIQQQVMIFQNTRNTLQLTHKRFGMEMQVLGIVRTL